MKQTQRQKKSLYYLLRMFFEFNKVVLTVRNILWILPSNYFLDHSENFLVLYVHFLSVAQKVDTVSFMWFSILCRKMQMLNKQEQRGDSPEGKINKYQSTFLFKNSSCQKYGAIFLHRFRLYMLSFMFRFMFANICLEKNQNSKIHVMFIINITWNMK